ncbi:MAG: SDR family oxidoreductase [Pseudomonadales bacterium]|nr:SDR family oxidoreductase [Pseudomonadales bacterium]
MKKVLIIGATSAIAISTSRLLAVRGSQMFLVGRNEVSLRASKDDLLVRGADKVGYVSMDLNETQRHGECLNEAIAFLGALDIVLIAHGTLSDQQACEASVELTLGEIKTNALSTVSLLTLLANLLENQGSGVLAVISSVAGDRGRGSNYVYGSAKAMVDAFLSGLRNRLSKKGVQVLTIKPGFVDTPMTAELAKGILWADPDTIAKGILLGIDKGRNIVYLPFFWRYIMLIIKFVPEFVFKRLSL